VRLAVSQGVGNPVDTGNPEALKSWATKEVRTLHEQSRKAVNALNPEPIVTGTSDGAGTYLTIWTSEVLPQDGKLAITARVEGDSATVYASYELTETYRSVAGVCSVALPGFFEYLQESAAGCDARLNLDTVNRVVTVDVRDDAVVAMTWTGTVQTYPELVRE
jgi:hypothetical protein